VGPKFECTENIGFASFGGGISGKSENRNAYSLQLSNLNGKETQTVVTVEVPVICAPLRRPQIPVELLKSFKGIEFADSNL
jgi:hypothetical protein